MQEMAITKRQEGRRSSHMDYFFSVGLVTRHRHGPLLEPVPDPAPDGQEVNKYPVLYGIAVIGGQLFCGVDLRTAGSHPIDG